MHVNIANFVNCFIISSRTLDLAKNCSNGMPLQCPATKLQAVHIYEGVFFGSNIETGPNEKANVDPSKLCKYFLEI